MEHPDGLPDQSMIRTVDIGGLDDGRVVSVTYLVFAGDTIILSC